MNDAIRKATRLELFYVLIMIPLWWAWTGHTLFANRLDNDDVFQRLMTLAQMAAAASLSVFIDPDFDPNYHGFLLSYVAIRGLLVLMYGRAAMLAEGACKDVAKFLAVGFSAGLLISLSSLLFEGPWKYTVLYLGIIVDILFPLVGRRYLARAPVESHLLRQPGKTDLRSGIGYRPGRHLPASPAKARGTRSRDGICTGFRRRPHRLLLPLQDEATRRRQCLSRYPLPDSAWCRDHKRLLYSLHRQPDGGIPLLSVCRRGPRWHAGILSRGCTGL